MANMIPEDQEQFTTDGEERVYKFFAAVAKPDINYTVWYSPDIKGREPDFILYNDTVGLVIFEVKDWSLKQIIQADRKRVVLFRNGREETKKNPMQQAKDYLFACMDALRNDGRLLSTKYSQSGNPRVPISCGVIFPNINKMEFQEKGYGEIIDIGKVFFWDDLHRESPQAKDATGKIFKNLLQTKFEPLFSFHLTEKEKAYLKQIIFPVVRVEHPRRQGPTEFSSLENQISSLDHHQEVVARKYERGHQILKGPPGCGKTLILIHKAIFLLRYNKNIRSILFVCFNITLVGYIKRLLNDKQVPLGKNGVDVVHFYEMCNRINRDKVEFEGQDQDYYQIIIEDTIEASRKYRKYDALIIDEGQDFSDDMLRVVFNLLNPATNLLTIALDENQNIYSKSRNWKKLGIHARGRTHSIKYIYRSTKELTEFASRFATGNQQLLHSQQPQQLDLFPGFFDYHGPAPVIEQYPTLDELLNHTADIVSLLVKKKCYSLSEIAILYTKSKVASGGNGVLPEMIGEALDDRGILYRWISADYRAKESYDITTDSVTVSTVHSVKGFDYAAVFVVGLDLLDQSRWTEEQVNHLTYVAITRARFRLYIPYLIENQIVNKLLSCK